MVDYDKYIPIKDPWNTSALNEQATVLGCEFSTVTYFMERERVRIGVYLS